MFCYIHIPFCKNKCKYCRFTSFVWKNNLEKEKYLKFLLKSISEFSFKSDKLDSIYIGWWTPTSLSNKQIWKIIFALKEKFGFKKNIEITLESTVSSISSKNLDFWTNNLAINRLSFWIQSLNNDWLKEIWRLDKKTILRKLNILKKHLCPKKTKISVNFDFIIWLPYVKKWEILEDLTYILENYEFVNHISLYMLEEFYDYPKKWHTLSIKEEEYLHEYVICKKFLEKNWFKRYEISNFARTRFSCKHNKSYWNHKEVVSFWLASHSFFDKTRFAYPNNFDEFYLWKIEFKEKLKKEEIFIEKILFSLRTSWIEKKLYQKLNQEKLKYFLENNLLKIKKDKIILTDSWVLIIDHILKEIIN